MRPMSNLSSTRLVGPRVQGGFPSSAANAFPHRFQQQPQEERASEYREESSNIPPLPPVANDVQVPKSASSGGFGMAGRTATQSMAVQNKFMSHKRDKNFAICRFTFFMILVLISFIVITVDRLENFAVNTLFAIVPLLIGVVGVITSGATLFVLMRMEAYHAMIFPAITAVTLFEFSLSLSGLIITSIDFAGALQLAPAIVDGPGNLIIALFLAEIFVVLTLLIALIFRGVALILRLVLSGTRN